LCDDGIDAFVEHPAPCEFAGDDAHAMGSLGMLHQCEVFGQTIVIRNEHFTRPRIALVAGLLIALFP
jgi:hypothetical protein